MNRSIVKLLPVTILLVFVAVPTIAQPLSERVTPNNPDDYRLLSSVHDGAGQMAFTGLIGRQDLSTNFLYLHAGEIHPGGGIGHHFHHTIEEMYVILNGEAEFTINGRTSRLQAPVIVPNKMGDSHALYNPTNDTLRWLNFAVSSKKGQGDAFDLGDDRVDAEIDSPPVFVSSQLDQDELSTDNHIYEGDGVLYRRVLGPEVFSTNWSHVDHLIVPTGSSAGPRQLNGIEEVYYVINGTGTLTIDNETTAIEADDAFSGFLGENVTISNEGKNNLELLVIGISASKKNDTDRYEPQAKPKAMVLQMDFIVSEENREAFERMYYSIYVPAMTVQEGYLSSKLLRRYPKDLARDIEAEPTEYNYQIQISFDTEENRQRWVKSNQHQIAWPAATGLAKEYKWRGYNVMGDHQRK
ncbi:cupin domain-containing protein [Aliifodinibius sp. S!AR15-10]|uniref:cupin domain-containing protein n=1 Tax=Aliifodinibius sp. S!AR15-10 TaxID=2950437 RepID=UPI00285AE620|nr:cupin domain-containing protein [Aliifodinibius sp. S!AR15-10]MDR8390899.1 cupin domain-containing protein [Aliifodinibius sp. S!AR15-10]